MAWRGGGFCKSELGRSCVRVAGAARATSARGLVVSFLRLSSFCFWGSERASYDGVGGVEALGLAEQLASESLQVFHLFNSNAGAQ